MQLILLAGALLTYLEEDKATQAQHSSLHGAVEVALPPEVGGGEDVCQADQPAPHAVAPLHVENELELGESHVMVHSVRDNIPYLGLMLCL